MPFPSHMLEDARDKQAVLVRLACNDASTWIHGIIKNILAGKRPHLYGMYSWYSGNRMLTGIDSFSKIEDLTVNTKNPKRELVAVDIYGKAEIDFHHEILKVEIKNGGGEYALDLAGARFGYSEFVAPWKSFEEERVRRFVIDRRYDLDKKPFGAMKRRLLDLAIWDMFYLTDRDASKTLESSTKKWEKEQKLMVLDVLDVLKLRRRLLRKDEDNWWNTLALSFRNN